MPSLQSEFASIDSIFAVLLCMFNAIEGKQIILHRRVPGVLRRLLSVWQCLLQLQQTLNAGFVVNFVSLQVHKGSSFFL
jgi:hypothetical protein